MSNNSIKHPAKWVTTLLVVATLAMMIVSQLLGEPSHYFTFVILPIVSVTFWMEYAKIRYSTNKRLWLLLVISLTAWSLIFTAFLFFITPSVFESYLTAN